ncbi:RTA1-like protein [Vararia minispora EC-137]|uniref:RTA1-like protein n=1 Tax=Vararia minispora EC-137 TaxID=1314806 RepID=A0ACB8QZI2_9AGAM|nr:RTA1-like protein [Vararia minispora EC-137]
MLRLLSFLAAIAVAHARQFGPQLPHPANPFADPKNDPYNPLGYIASDTLTAIAFSFVLTSAIVQTFMMRKWGAWWMSCMVIGEYTFAVGTGSRFGLARQPESRPIYIVEYLFVVLSPCAFIAADYVLLGRLARHLNAGQHLLIRPSRIMITFVVSDITTFLIQAAGGGVSIGANTPQQAKTGSNIFLAGLAIQLVSFLTFSAIFVYFVLRVHKFEPQAWTRDAGKRWYDDWRALAAALALSCIGIVIRSFYRVVELTQGFQGPIAENEPLFYGLDTLPLFIAVVVYVPFWPGRFILPQVHPPVGKDAEATPTNTAGERNKVSTVSEPQ